MSMFTGYIRLNILSPQRNGYHFAFDTLKLIDTGLKMYVDTNLTELSSQGST